MINYIKYTNNTVKVCSKEFKTIKSAINYLCMRNFRTYDSSKKVASKILGTSSKCPIYVNKRILLVPTSSDRNDDCIFINFNNVLTYEELNSKVCITFTNNDVIYLNQTEYTVNRMKEKYLKINEYIKEVETLY